MTYRYSTSILYIAIFNVNCAKHFSTHENLELKRIPIVFLLQFDQELLIESINRRNYSMCVQNVCTKCVNINHLVDHSVV